MSSVTIGRQSREQIRADMATVKLYAVMRQVPGYSASIDKILPFRQARTEVQMAEPQKTSGVKVFIAPVTVLIPQRYCT